MISYNPLREKLSTKLPVKKDADENYYVFQITIIDQKTGQSRISDDINTGIPVVAGGKNYAKAINAREQSVANIEATNKLAITRKVIEFLGKYCELCESKNISPSSTLKEIISASKAFIEFSKFGSRGIAEVTAANLRSFFSAPEILPHREQYYLCLKEAFAIRNWENQHNPFDEFDFAFIQEDNPNAAVILSPEQVSDIYIALPKNSYLNRIYASFFLLLCGSNLDVKSAAKLKLDDLDWDQKTIGIVHMTKYAEIAIINQLENKQVHSTPDILVSQFIFCDENGIPYNIDFLIKEIYKRSKPLCRELKIPTEGLKLRLLRHRMIQNVVSQERERAAIERLLDPAEESIQTLLDRILDMKAKLQSVRETMSE